MIVGLCPLADSHSFAVDEQVAGHKPDMGQAIGGPLEEVLADRTPGTDQATDARQEVLAGHTPGMDQGIVGHQPAHFHSSFFRVVRSLVVAPARTPGKALGSQLAVEEHCH